MTFIINTKREATPEPRDPSERDREERKLTKVRVSIMREKTFLRWSGLLMMGDVYVDDHIPTACTNGRDERYGRQLIRLFFNKEKITAAQLPMKLQTYKAQSKDPKCVINADAGADFKHVVVVLDEVRKIGIAKVGINTDKK